MRFDLGKAVLHTIVVGAFTALVLIVAAAAQPAHAAIIDGRPQSAAMAT